MSINEIIEKKTDLSKQISDLINNFETENSVSISDIDFQQSAYQTISLGKQQKVRKATIILKIVL